MPLFVQVDGDDLVVGASLQRAAPTSSLFTVLEVIPAYKEAAGYTLDPFTEVYMAGRLTLFLAATCYRAGNTLVQRTPVCALEWDEGTHTFTVPACPAGTTLSIADKVGREIIHQGDADTEEATTISLSDPGVYEIEVEGPLPLLPVSLEVTVDA